MDALEVNRAIGEMYGYRIATTDAFGKNNLAYIVERKGKKERLSDDWVSPEEVAWKERSPNWAFDARAAVKLITHNARFTIEVCSTCFRVVVKGTDIEIERPTFAHAVSEAWYLFTIKE